MEQQQIQKNQNKSEEIKTLLNKAIEKNQINNWKIDSGISQRQNIYMEKDFIVESILNAKREGSHITIYKNFDEENKIGENSFSFSTEDTIEDFEKELKDAIYISQHSKSKKYTIPTNKDKNVEDLHIDYSIFHNKQFIEEFNSGELEKFTIDKINIFKELIKQNQKNEFTLILNSCEIFNKISTSNLETSKNINKSYKKNSTYLEFIMTIKDNKTQEEIEHVVYESINNIYDFNFNEFFTRHINFVIDKSKAINMKHFKGKVTLKDFACYDFFVPYPQNCSPIIHCSARLKFLEMSKYEKEKETINSKLDKLTLYSNPLRKNNAYSAPYDELGISAQKTCLIEDSIFKNHFASKQYADYLKLEATGPVGTFEIGCGKKSYKEFYNEQEDIVEILAFAWFAPDALSGNVSAEIRLGYIIKPNGEKIPFKGGLFSGNLFNLLEEVEFSSESIEKPGYFGPSVIKFHKAEIIGNN